MKKARTILVGPNSEAARSTADEFFAGLGAPARRALENAGIHTVFHLSHKTKKEILQLHGMGPSSIPKLEEKLKAAGLHFK